MVIAEGAQPLTEPVDFVEFFKHFLYIFYHFASHLHHVLIICNLYSKVNTSQKIFSPSFL